MTQAAPLCDTPSQAPSVDRPRVLAVAYACHPTHSAESRVGWARVLMASENHDVTVLCGPPDQTCDLNRLASEHGATGRIKFVVVPHARLAYSCFRHDLFHMLGYRAWHRRAVKVARRLHEETPFDVVHQVNYCGYREPGYCWKLGAPFVWGPVGGTQNFPLRFLSVADVYSAAREIGRNVVNAIQLRCGRRWRRAADASSVLLAATRCAQRDLQRCLNIQTPVELEAGLSYPARPPREARDPQAPLRVLWTGRLRAWKGLPLLLKALAQLPEGVRFEVRVLGEGAGEKPYRRMAERLGIADKIEWVGWGPYPDTLPHYDWADVFAFTSLRDTSGAGLLEALAAGAPIVGLDHQGAADIMDPSCALAVKPTSPGKTIRGFAQALTLLALDRRRLLQLSHGATRRAESYEWRRRMDVLNDAYRTAMGSQAAGSVSTASIGASTRVLATDVARERTSFRATPEQIQIG